MVIWVKFLLWYESKDTKPNFNVLHNFLHFRSVFIAIIPNLVTPTRTITLLSMTNNSNIVPDQWDEIK